MRTPLAFLNLVHEKTRLGVAIAGVAFAVILVFMNLGFLGALSETAAAFYARFNADLFLISPQALEITTATPFPIERIYQVAGVEGVEDVMPLYVNYIQWRNPETRENRAIFAFGINPDDPAFLLPELQSAQARNILRRPNTIFFDRLSRPEYGPQETGTRTEADRRDVVIGGQYSLGGGFAADGTIIMSDQNFRRYFNPFPLDQISVGLIKLEEAVDADEARLVVMELLPEDVEVYTKDGIVARDRNYWISATSTGFIFGMGVAVALVVGVVIVYQILYTDISSHMKQYATLKAMGYRSGFLFYTVLQESVILAVLGFIPGFILSMILYQLTLTATSGTLPVVMTLTRFIFVFILTIFMCGISGLISVNKVIQADPAEVF
ncbi:MAG: ABC transporter permease DevC [Cyanobacteria bacterium J06638_22]